MRRNQALRRTLAAAPHGTTDWRKKQLDRLETKFTEPQAVESEEDLQPMWKEMERRVRSRRPRTLAETGGRSGRSNVRQTDEDVWLRAGLYDDDEVTEEENENKP